MFKLVIHEVGKDAREIILEEGRYTLGRDEGNDIVLSDDAASRKHACIRFENGVYVLEDLQSTAGVYLNKERIRTECPLKAGDNILVGSTKLSFEEEQPEPEADMDDDKTKVLSPDLLKKYLEEEKAGREDDTAVFHVAEEAAPAHDEDDKTRILSTQELVIPGQPEPGGVDAKTIIVKPAAITPPVEDDRTVIVSAQGARPSSAGRHRLVGFSKELSGSEFVLEQADTTVGRSEECTITIDDATISSYHARFRTEGDSCFVTDMGSRNGTWVNGARVGEEHQLTHGDEIKLGSVKLHFVHRDTTASAEEVIAQLRRQGSQKRMKLAGIGGAALLCIIIILVLLSPESDQGAKKPAEQRAKQEEDALVPLAATPPAASSEDEPIKADALATSSADIYFDTAQELLSYRLWNEAAEKLAEVQKIDAQYPGVDEALVLAMSEGMNRDLFEKGLRLISEGSLEDGIRSLEGIPENSVYSAEALLEIQFAREQLPGFQAETSLDGQPSGEAAGGSAPGQDFVDQVLKYYAQGDIKISLTKLDTALSASGVDSDEALKAQLTALKEKIAKVEELFAKGQSQYDKKNFKEAFKTWSQVISIDQELVGDAKSHFSNSIAAYMADEMYRQARTYYEKGNYSAARDTCMKALTASPRHEGCLEIAESLGQIARKIFEEGYILEDLNPGMAVKKWRKVLEVCPPDNPYYEKAKAKIARYETP